MIVHKSEGGEEVAHVREAKYESVTQAIVAAVAKLEGCDRVDVSELFAASDSDALNRLFDESNIRENLTVKMTIGKYTVECEKSGEITCSRSE